MKYTGVIFDFNGVLLWDDEWHIQAWKEVGHELLGREITEQEFKEFWGRPNAGVFEYLFQITPKADELKNLITLKEQKYRDIAIKQKDFMLSPGCETLLDKLRDQRIPFTMATSSEIVNVTFFFESLKLDRWFDMKKIVYDDGSMKGKPNPDVYLLAAQRIGLPPDTCMVVEDAKSGLIAAASAGIGKIIALVHDRNDTEKGSMPGVKKVIRSLEEVSLDDLE